jgi:Fibronectin type III domain.
MYLSKPVITGITAAKGQVTIKWDMAVVGAISYDVYYMAYPGGTWKKAISAAPIDKSCVVKGLTSGQTYSFKLVAVNGSSRSVDSATKNATAK